MCHVVQFEDPTESFHNSILFVKLASVKISQELFLKSTKGSFKLNYNIVRDQ